MNEGIRESWDRYRQLRCDVGGLGVWLDVSRVRFDEGYLAQMRPALTAAMDAMAALEGGAIANPDERRMVGHYWLRAPELAPTPGIGDDIRTTVRAVCEFAVRVRDGALRGPGGPFDHVVHVGIGGSALGPQLICDALGAASGRLDISFLDNIDPDGVDRLLERLGSRLDRTLVSLVSKSGWTPTPRLVASALEAAYRDRGLVFARHAVATTMAGTDLDARASRQRWLRRFPIWDWVGGRTSITSAVGLLPAALIGVDVIQFLDGAAAMDRITRDRDLQANPAALLALMWHWLGRGHGSRRMVVLAYRDRLSLLARYVQQLVMESIGKRADRAGTTVHQGLTVFGHKGATDQHSYLQQLRDGTPDFFVLLVGVRQDPREPPAPEASPGSTLGDHLFGSLVGTRRALWERGRDSMTISLPDLGPRSLGALVALLERAVGLYAELIDVNAYHQPGVDKEAAMGAVELQRAIVARLRKTGRAETAEEIATAIGRAEEVATVYELLERLVDNPGRGVISTPGPDRFEDRFMRTAAG